MAEIRSTMDMVMERAAKMAAESTKEIVDDTTVKEGMRLAADYLIKGQDSILKYIEGKKITPELMAGMAETLLRNIVLPRDTMLQENGLKALAALAELGSEEIMSICSELQQILSQYNQHKEQTVQQVDDAILAQLKQKLMQQGTQVTEDMSISPSMHPQYQEEMNKVLADLNDQYNQALDQRKDMIKQTFQ